MPVPSSVGPFVSVLAFALSLKQPIKENVPADGTIVAVGDADVVVVVVVVVELLVVVVETVVVVVVTAVVVVVVVVVVV